MERILKQKSFFEFLGRLPPKSISTVLRYASPQIIKALVEIVNNRHKLSVTPHQIKLLKRHKKYYTQLGDCCNKHNKVNVSKARSYIISTPNQTGGALPLLLAALLPLIAKAALAGVVSAGSGLAVKALVEK